MSTSRYLRLGSWCWVVLALALAGQVPLEAAAPPERPAPVEKAEYRIFRLRNAAAPEVARTLRELLGERIGPKGARIAIAVDERSNSLLVSESRAHLEEIEAILTRLDVEGGSREDVRPFVKIFPLDRIEPDESLESALKLVFAGSPGKFTIDHRRRLVVALGTPPTLEEVHKLLTGLSLMSDARPGPPDVELQIRLFWLVNGPARKDAPGLPAELKEIAPELARLGLDKPSLATQVSVSTVPGSKFEASGVAELAAPSILSVSGGTMPGRDKLNLQLTIGVTQEPRRGSRRSGSLRTQVGIGSGGPVVVGVIPTLTQTSAFVVQVVGKVPAPPKGPGRLPGKAISIEFRDRPWSAVFTWLSEQTGLPVVTQFKPTGTFTFIPPNPEKRYTMPEIIDILNEALMARQNDRYLLIRRESSFYLQPADEKPELIPRVRVEDLKDRGKTELVSVMIQLRSLRADDIAPDVKKLLGPFGAVAVLKSANALLVEDVASRLRQVHQVIEDVENKAAK
jgi:hypothetical protein